MMRRRVARRAGTCAPTVGSRVAPAGVFGVREHAYVGRRLVAADIAAAGLATVNAVGVLRAHRGGGQRGTQVPHRARDVTAARQVADAADLVYPLFGEPDVLFRACRDALDFRVPGRGWGLADA